MSRHRLFRVVVRLSATVALAATLTPAPADSFDAEVRPLVARYCAECHSPADKAGDLDLARFATAADVAADPAPWQLAVDQLRCGAMPPAGAPQPTAEERATLRAGIRRELLVIAAKTAGDPGRVVLRRLSNAEYRGSIRDLTGVGSLDPGKEFPVDGAAGEGFTNVGQALVMSPEMVEKYLAAAKDVAAHAVLTPEGIRFSPSTMQRDWTEEALAGIREIYARNTVDSGATSVNLQGIAFDTNAGGRLPLVACLAAALAEREGLLAGTMTPQAAAAKHGVSAKYLGALLAALTDPAPCLPLEGVRAQWRLAAVGDAQRLAGLIEAWQAALWTFNTIGHIGKRDGPTAWQTPVTPLAERREIRVKLPASGTAGIIPVWFVVGEAGDGAVGDLAIFEFPRIVAPGKPDLLLADLCVGAAASGPDGAIFGRRADGEALERTSLALAAPIAMRIELPEEMSAGAELVTTATVAEAAGSIQADVVLEAPGAFSIVPGAAQAVHGKLWSDGSGPPASSNPILVRDGARRAALEAQCAMFRETFPAALCYSKIVPVDEVVTLTLYHREDDHLKRLVLSESEAARLDELWNELHFVSGDALQLVDAYEQLWQYATQDADPSAFEVLRQPILDRAAAYRTELVATEPVHNEAVLKIARRAWRRPLTASEIESFRSLYTRLRAEKISHGDAIRALLARVLAAPAFLYHLETAPPGDAARPVSDHELAARLASVLWSSLPDAELMTLADADRLHEPAVLAGQVTRMLHDERVERLAVGFGCQWLQIADFDTLDEKSPVHFPEFAGLRHSMQGEAVRFFADFFSANRPVTHLLDADYTFADPLLAAFYGAATPPEEGTAGGDWQRIDGMQARGRGGILGLAAVLAKQSGASRTSPILRGAWLAETVLGRKLPKPPKGIPVLPEVPPEGLTERTLTELHSTQAACAGCHRTIDPYGCALEGFDAIGRLRTQDTAGNRVDTKALLPARGADDPPTAVEGLSGLRGHLVSHHRDEFVRQFCKKLLGFFLARSVQLSDEPLLERLEAAAEEGGATMVQIIVASPQFLTIRGRDMLLSGVAP